MTALPTGRGDQPALDLERAREFYRKHAEEVVSRMRHPSAPTNNIAAVMVAEFETNTRLRTEANEALDAARSAREARRALDVALGFYS